MQDTDLELISTDKVLLPLFREKEITVAVLRLDTIHPLISGNKYFKLRNYLTEARQLGKTNIVTFGGAWSNHILATAAACNQYQLDCTGIIRGEETRSLSPTLLQARQLGMKLVFLSREEYTLQKRDAALTNSDTCFISEGGFGIKGAEGAATIADHYDTGLYSHLCCAAGTGTMTAGLLMRAPPHQQVLSFSVLKNNKQLKEDIISLTGTVSPQLSIIDEYHFGGYAKYTQPLINFMNDFYRQTAIPSDFVYTGKLFYGITALAEKNHFAPGSTILIIHSGDYRAMAL